MPNPDPILTDADGGRTIAVATGKTFAVDLRENASTGFRWSLDPPGNDNVTVIDVVYAASSGTVGGGGNVRWLLQARKPGTARLRFKLWRPWEGESSVQKEVGFTIKAGP